MMDNLPERRSWLEPPDPVEKEIEELRCCKCTYYSDATGWCCATIPAWVDDDYGSVKYRQHLAEDCELYKEEDEEVGGNGFESED